MNDFSELEKDLKALRPARPSPVLFERIEGAIAENCRVPMSGARPIANWFWRFREAPYRFGIGLAAAAAAVVLLIARINIDQTQNQNTEIAQVSPPSQTKPVLPSFLEEAVSLDRCRPTNSFPLARRRLSIILATRACSLLTARGNR